jgi:hypothetical protein
MQRYVVESLQSHMIITMSHWSSGLPVCFPPQGTQVQIPWGDLCETGILLLACLATLVTPTWSDHWLRHPQGASLGSVLTMCKPRSTWSHSFPFPVSRSLQVPFWLHNWRSRLLGGALSRACNLTWFSPCLTGPVDYLFASRHKGHRFKSPGGTHVKPGFSC